MKPELKKRNDERIYFYKLILRYIGVRNRKVTIEEIREDWSKEYNEKGVSTDHINRVLKSQEERGNLKSERYDNDKRGPNPKQYWITETGMKETAYRWPDLEYDDDMMELKEKDI